MAKNAFKEVLALPALLWLGFVIVALIIGFTQEVNTSVDLLIGNTPVFFALLFGIWIGRRSFKHMGENLNLALINGLMLSIMIGALSVICILLLANSSASFAQAYGALGSPSQYTQSISLVSILESGVSSWVTIVLVTVVAAAMGFEFSSKK